jgi:hypothetical protein
MVTAELTWRPGESRCIHWPDYASVDMLHLRICKAFLQNWRLVRVIVTLGGRDLFEFEKPWLWLRLPRHSKVQLDVRFESRPADEAVAFEWAPGDDGDESDGYTTTSSVAEQIESIGF